ncbi:23S rRNA pseudouridine(955/2504/2580) synthase RluC [Vibrio sp. SS-MA-C1-2]|uniref:23S rRNA pseudouridine(955/2504/2580) synthase RluC n=1 Tax=Vibrio sp. SS-MA-C1-2 TaxID=2908646 RepID=UPI001F2A4FA6|nr:23S rRNA pseudouridine(955/2504/2580) synthase RluC [Vibrio sp. SS-MA-C1-2]UJF19911.1 23S rRNA pseudouridine(955/2504/2580) synthase RluC [Vibrio sp. SS-MA-C1-2]
MNEQKSAVQFVEVSDDFEGQRVDNFLRARLKNIPKSLIYRILRKGEVRVNKKRIKPEYKLQPGDVVRVPPMRIPDTVETELPSTKLDKVSELESCVIYEDEHLLILNKPSGTAVHGGSGLKFGVIEAMRALRPQAHYLELVHRIDRDTSGILLIAKKRSALRRLQETFRNKTVQKYYYALVAGHWDPKDRRVNAPLLKNEINSIVRVNPNGKESETRYKIIENFEHATLVEASPITGRTHQIRVHCQYKGHPIAWDDRYGDPRFDAYTKKTGMTRLFLHAHSIRFTHPSTEEVMTIEAPMEATLLRCIDKLREQSPMKENAKSTSTKSAAALRARIKTKKKR